MTNALTTEQTEAEALRTVAGLRRRDDLVVYRVSGDDQRSWLNGQVTCDIRNTTPGQGVYGLAITVKGRVMADLWVLDLGEDDLHVAMPKDAASAVTERFETQIIMEDVELLVRPELSVMSVQGPRGAALTSDAAADGEQVVSADELGIGGCLVLTQEADACWSRLSEAVTAAGGAVVTDPGWELARIGLGVPRFERDFGDDTYPQEAGLKARAVSFNKGCYVGQEVVCTLENRGRLSRQLCRLHSETALTPGTVVRDGDVDIGRITSAAASGPDAHVALGYVKRAFAQPAQRLSTDVGPLEVVAVVGEA